MTGLRVVTDHAERDLQFNAYGVKLYHKAWLHQMQAAQPVVSMQHTVMLHHFNRAGAPQGGCQLMFRGFSDMVCSCHWHCRWQLAPGCTHFQSIYRQEASRQRRAPGGVSGS